jgi:hypothetical protein
MELHHVETLAAGVVGLETRWMLVGEAAQFQAVGGTADLAEGGHSLGGTSAALALDGV